MEDKDSRKKRLQHIQLAAAKRNRKGRKNWQPEEDIALKLAQELGLTVAQTGECMDEDDELNYRCYTRRSIEARRMKLRLGKSRPSTLQNQDLIMARKKSLKEVEQTLVEYSNALSIIVKCDKCNHVWEKTVRGVNEVCSKCSARTFVGGMPIGSKPALVYLLIFPEWDKCKIGYCEIGVSSSPEEAIHKTSKGRNYPSPYIIGAYDLSTKTEAGILEDRLLRDTFDSRAFIETQEFGGYTEFRNIKVLKQLLPQYKTVLDTAFRI